MKTSRPVLRDWSSRENSTQSALRACNYPASQNAVTINSISNQAQGTVEQSRSAIFIKEARSGLTHKEPSLVVQPKKAREKVSGLTAEVCCACRSLQEGCLPLCLFSVCPAAGGFFSFLSFLLFSVFFFKLPWIDLLDIMQHSEGRQLPHAYRVKQLLTAWL